MATLFDLGIMEGLGLVFALILVFVLVYGFLSKVQVLGEGKDGLYALIAFVVAVLVIITPAVRHMILFMAPWFGVVIFVGFFLLFLLMIFGMSAGDLYSGSSTAVISTFMVVAFVIFVFSGISYMSSPPPVEDNETEVEESRGIQIPAFLQGSVDRAEERLLHPQVLGMVVMLLVGAFAVFFLTKPSG